jgi:ribonuclease HI
MTKFRGVALWLGADPPLTNNEAEYKGLIAGLQAAKSLGIKKLSVEGDSQLIVRQLLGEYKVRNERLKPLHAEAEALIAAFTTFDIKHIERAENADADALVNQAMDEEECLVVGVNNFKMEERSTNFVCE